MISSPYLRGMFSVVQFSFALSRFIEDEKLSDLKVTINRFWFKIFSNIIEHQACRRSNITPLPPMWPGFDSQTWRHIWVAFVGSLLGSERFFPRYSDFPLSLVSKHQFSRFIYTE